MRRETLVPVIDRVVGVARDKDVFGPGGSPVARQPKPGGRHAGRRILVFLPVLERLPEGPVSEPQDRAGHGRPRMRIEVDPSPIPPRPSAVGRADEIAAHPEQALGDGVDPWLARVRAVRPQHGCDKLTRLQLGDVPAAGLSRPVVPDAFVEAQESDLPRFAAVGRGEHADVSVGSLAVRAQPARHQHDPSASATADVDEAERSLAGARVASQNAPEPTTSIVVSLWGDCRQSTMAPAGSHGPGPAPSAGETRGHDHRRRLRSTSRATEGGPRHPVPPPRPRTVRGQRRPALQRHCRRRQGLASPLEGSQVAVDRSPPDGLRRDRCDVREGLRSGGHGRRWHPQRARRQRARDAAEGRAGRPPPGPRRSHDLRRRPVPRRPRQRRRDGGRC